MTSDIGFSDAPAPMALGDIESGTARDDAAPAPVDIGGLGSVTGDAPAPADLGGEIGAIAGTAPEPADLGGFSAGSAEVAAPSPVGGPGDIRIGEIGEQGSQQDTPSPMDLSTLEALEAG